MAGHPEEAARTPPDHALTLGHPGDPDARRSDARRSDDCADHPGSASAREQDPTLTLGLTARAKAAGAAARDLPRAFGDYLLLQEIARGGMGVVYKARQNKLQRIVALKMIQAGNWASDDEIQRFYVEAEASARLDHAAIVPIFEVGEHDGHHFFSMGFVEGGSLAVRLRTGPLPPHEAAALMARVADAVDYAHARGIIHRDLKPGNILLDRDGQPKVTDFGLAKIVAMDSHLTMTGQVVGTASYMAPEQAAGKQDAIGPAADVYALGATLYCLLTGRPPFHAATPLETIQQVLQREPVSLRHANAAVSRDLETICHKCLQKEPTKRYASAAALAADLRRYLAGETIEARPVGELERLWRWCRRNRTVAALLATVALTLVLGTGFSLYYAIRARAGEALANANAEQARAAKALSDRRLYVSQINLVQQELRNGQIALAEERLADLAPRGQDAPDLRGFEWHYLRRLCRQDLRTFTGHKRPVRGVAFSPDGLRIASAGGAFYQPGEIILWDAVTGQAIRTLEGDFGPVWSVAFSPDGRRLASASGYQKDPAIHIWDADTGKHLLLLHGHPNRVTSVAFSPDSRTLASAGDDHTIRIWDPATGAEIRVMHRPQLQLSCVAFSPDGRELASGGDHETIVIWDWRAGKEVRTIRLHPVLAGSVYRVAYSPDGRWLAAGTGAYGNAGDVKIVEAATGQLTHTLQGHTADVRDVAFTPDSRRLASASEDHTVRVWDLATGRETLVLRGHAQGVTAVAYRPDGRCLASASGDLTVKLWDAAAPLDAVPLRGHSAAVWSAAYSPDGRRLVSSGADHMVRVWDTATAREVATLRGHEHTVYAVAFSPTGAQVASGGEDRTVCIWDAHSGSRLFRFGGLPGSITAAGLAFSADGSRLAAALSGFDDKGIPLPSQVRMWDTATGAELLTLHEPASILALAFTADGRWFATGGAGKVVKLWNAANGEEICSLHGHASAIWAVAFSADGTRLASADEAGTIKVWDTLALAAGETQQPLLSLHAHAGRIYRVAFSPDGLRLASASGGQEKGSGHGLPGEVKIWDIGTASETLRLASFPGAVNGVAFSPDGLHLVTACASDEPDQGLTILDAAPLTAEVQQQREARSVVRYLFGKGLGRTEVLARVRADATIDDAVRQKALALAEHYAEDPLGIADARRAVVQTGATRRTYNLAENQARRACAFAPENSLYRATYGMAKFRLGAYQAAQEALTHANQLDAAARTDPAPATLAFLAMAEYKLGHKERASVVLGRLRSAMNQSRWAKDAEAQALFREAETLIAGKARAVAN